MKDNWELRIVEAVGPYCDGSGNGYGGGRTYGYTDGDGSGGGNGYSDGGGTGDGNDHGDGLGTGAGHGQVVPRGER